MTLYVGAYRRGMAMAALCISAFATDAARAAPATDAAKIHDEAIVIDAHADLPHPRTRLPDVSGPIDSGTQVDFAKLRAGRVDVLFPSLFIAQGPRTLESFDIARRLADEKLAAIRAIAETRPDQAVLALSADDIMTAVKQKKTAIMIGMLNAYPLGTDPDALRHFYNGGVRIFGLTHGGNNDFADSSRLKPGDREGENGGLSTIGKSAVALANDLGILLDVSQLSTRALFQATELSRAPVIASHSAVRALIDTPRNLSDGELDAIKKNGGVVAVVAFDWYLRSFNKAEIDRIEDLKKKYDIEGEKYNTNWGWASYLQDLPEAERIRIAGHKGLTPQQSAQYFHDVMAITPKANLDNLIDHIDYVVRRIGIDHVAISSDFDHNGGITGWMDESEAPNVTAALIRRGYSAADIRKLWGGNILRILRIAEERATIRNGGAPSKASLP